MLLAALPAAASPTNKSIIIDLNTLTWKAMVGDEVVRSGKAVGGSYRCSDNPRKSCKSPVGEFVVLRKYGALKRSDLYPLDCKDKSVCGAKMWHQIKVREDGVSIHGVTNNNLPDHNASHGCIRVSIEAAKFLNREFVEVGKTKVIVLPY